MKIEMSVHEVRRFLMNAAQIKSSGMLPIHGYILLNNDYLSKTNDNAFVVMDITQTKSKLLLEERILSAFIKGTTKDKFTIEVKGERIILSDGVNKPYFSVEDPTNFPKFPESDKKDEIKLPENVLKAIGIASKNVLMGSKINNNFEFVHIKDSHVFATDGNKFYFSKFENLPDIIIDYDTASVIKDFGAVNYYTQGNFNFYQAGGTLYAFKKTEVKTPAFMPIAQSFCKTPYMEFNNNELIGFLELATSLSPSPDLYVTMNGNFLSFSDDDYNVGNEREMEVMGDYRPEINMLPKVVLPFFKSLNTERIRVSPITGRPSGLSVWSEEGDSWYAMVAGAVFEKEQK